MFGITRLTPEEKAEHERKKRCVVLNSLLLEETQKRNASLEASKKLRKELEELEASE